MYVRGNGRCKNSVLLRSPTFRVWLPVCFSSVSVSSSRRAVSVIACVAGMVNVDLNVLHITNACGPKPGTLRTHTAYLPAVVMIIPSAGRRAATQVNHPQRSLQLSFAWEKGHRLGRGDTRSSVGAWVGDHRPRPCQHRLDARGRLGTHAAGCRRCTFSHRMATSRMGKRGWG